MSLEQTAQPTFYMAPTSTRDLAVSFVKTLVAGELLTGTPTVTISGGPTISAPTVNSAVRKIEAPDGEHWAAAGQAVLFRATASAATPGSYTVTIRASTVGGQVIPGYAIIVVQAS
jgi:hypothetical protein